mmetsp:Transcript_4445/g.11677  ORF Transcript_4445/g.11677 Transcript_4445/m.11677 type:complete len:224 (+) Transcript_4445:269-940(+)
MTCRLGHLSMGAAHSDESRRRTALIVAHGWSPIRRGSWQTPLVVKTGFLHRLEAREHVPLCTLAFGAALQEGALCVQCCDTRVVERATKARFEVATFHSSGTRRRINRRWARLPPTIGTATWTCHQLHKVVRAPSTLDAQYDVLDVAEAVCTTEFQYSLSVLLERKLERIRALSRLPLQWRPLWEVHAEQFKCCSTKNKFCMPTRSTRGCVRQRRVCRSIQGC